MKRRARPDRWEQAFRETILVGVDPKLAEALREVGRVLFYGREAKKNDPWAECEAVVEELRQLEDYLNATGLRVLSDSLGEKDEVKAKLGGLMKRCAQRLGHEAEAFERDLAESRKLDRQA